MPSLFVFGLLASIGMLAPEVALADTVNSLSITMNVDTNRSTGNGAGNVGASVNTIILTETAVAEYSSGGTSAITVQVRPGFQFDSASNVTAQSTAFGFNGSGINVIASVAPTGAADETITFALTSGGTAGLDNIHINGIKLKILSATGAAGPTQTPLGVTTTAAGGALTNQSPVTATINTGVADHLLFSAQPVTTLAGSDLLPAVTMVDFGNNTVTNDVRTITLAIQPNPGAAALLGTTLHATISGVAAWAGADDLRITKPAVNYTLQASHSGANFLTSQTVDSAGFDIRSLMDVDGNGQADALTDGLLLLRYLFGLRGDSLIAGAVAADATRTTAAEIESYIQTILP